MTWEETRELLERLTGQAAPFRNPEPITLFEGAESGLGYSQLNELLLLFGFDRVSRAFFRFLLDGKTDYEPGDAFTSPAQLEEGVARFRRLAVLLYGNVKFAFKSLSRDPELLRSDLERLEPVPGTVFTTRHRAILPLESIAPEDAYLTGYIIEDELDAKLASNPSDAAALELEARRKSVVRRATKNQKAYLASDHLDVYVATSMRRRYEFLAVSRLATAIFQNEALTALNLRWFDPTQAYCPDRIDKGLSEALMLRRATCTIYLAQETDTLGKDSELASTLAQGKPVVAMIPEVTDASFEEHLKTLQEAEPGADPTKLMLDQLQVFAPHAAWEDAEVRGWCESPASADVGALRSRLRSQMAKHYNKRAETLIGTHPLGIQVNLETGVANGVLVVRTIADCAQLVRNIVTSDLQFELEENEKFVLLREKISRCIFRVVTRDAMLTNTYWNFYLDPAE